MSTTADEPSNAALSSTTGFLKFSTGFAAGALAFSVGLLPDKVSLSSISQYFLAAAWIMLTVSLGAGVMVYARIPIKLAENNFDLEDPWFIWPGRVHHLAFAAGIVCLGVVLLGVAIRFPSSEYSIKSAQDAVKVALKVLPNTERVLEIKKVETIKGTDSQEQEAIVWHVQISSINQAVAASFPKNVEKLPPNLKNLDSSTTSNGHECAQYPVKERGDQSPSSPAVVPVLLSDIFVNAKTGEIIKIPRNP